MFKQICVALLCLLTYGAAVASESKVVVTINPIHSLAAAVMDGVLTPELLIKSNDSPHGFQTKPSDARLMENAEVIVWVSPNLESTLIDSISILMDKTAVVEIGTLHGLHLYENRESPDAHGGHEEHHDDEDEHHGDDEDKHAHDEEHHDEEDEHGHDDEHHGEEDGHGHDEDKHAHNEEHHDDEDEHGHDDEHHGEEDEHGHDDEHHHGRYDMHVWLDVDNAKVITKELTEQFVKVFPEHEAQITANMNKTMEKLDTLEHDLRSRTQSISGLPYIVFHDAYQYFEKMLKLNNVGTVTINPDASPGARKLVELRETVRETGATCVFKEPQFNPKSIEIIAEGTDLKIGTLDPLGADVEPGPDAYFQILRNLADSLNECLG